MVAQPLPLLAILAGLARPKATGSPFNGSTVAAPDSAEPSRGGIPRSGGTHAPPGARTAPAGFRRRRSRSNQPRLLRVLPEFRPFEQADDQATTNAAAEPLAPDAVATALAGATPSVFTHLVQGDDMRDALVSAGDSLILEQTAVLRAGELVAAWLPNDDELVLRRVYPEGASVRLQSEDRLRASEWVRADALRVHGRVVAILRHSPRTDLDCPVESTTSAAPLFAQAARPEARR